MFVAMHEISIFADISAIALTTGALTKQEMLKYYDFCAVISKLIVDKSGNDNRCRTTR